MTMRTKRAPRTKRAGLEDRLEDRNAERDLARAQDRIRKLETRLEERERAVRTFQARLAALEGAQAERDELEAEIRALRGEAKELTRANREQVKKNEALQAEIARLKTAGAKARSLAA